MVLSALQEKWTHVEQDEYDVSSIDGSTFKNGLLMYLNLTFHGESVTYHLSWI